MTLDLTQGERRAAANTTGAGRSGAFSELIANDIGLGKYFEAARLGKLYSTFSKAITVAATHNSPISANTATPVVGFGNTSTGTAAVLLRVGFGTTSGTPAGGQAVLNLQATGANVITAAATGNIFNHLLQGGISPQGSAMKPWNNVALTGWIGTPNAVQEINILGIAPAVAAAGNSGAGVVGEELAGQYVIPPGGLCAIMAGSGAGTTWIVNASLTWAEIPWPL